MAVADLVAEVTDLADTVVTPVTGKAMDTIMAMDKRMERPDAVVAGNVGAAVLITVADAVTNTIVNVDLSEASVVLVFGARESQSQFSNNKLKLNKI